MKYLVLILLLTGGITPTVFSQKKKKEKSTEERIKVEALDDLTVFSQRDYPFLDLFHDALAQKMAGNIAEARRLFKQCLGIQPNNSAVLYSLAELAKGQNLRTEAIAYYQQALLSDPDNHYIIQEIAFLEFERANFKEAAVSFEKLIAKEPRQLDWLYAYGQSLVYIKDYSKAIYIFDKIQDQVGNIPEISMMKVDLLRELKRFDEAEKTLLETKNAHPDNLEVLRNVIGYYEEFGEEKKALELIKELAAKDQDNGVAHFILARYYLEQKDPKAFVKTLNPIMKSDEIHIHDKILLLQELFSLDQSYKEVMIEISNNLVNAHPKEAKALAMAGEILGHFGDTREALKNYRAALQLENAEFRLWSNVLALESAYRDYPELYADAQEAMNFFPNMPFVYYAAAEGAIYLDKLDEAQEILDAGALLIIDDSNQSSRFNMRYGELYARKGDIKTAVTYFEKALKYDDESLLIRSHYALALAKEKLQLEKAAKLIQSFNTPQQTNTTFYLAQGWIFKQKGDYDKAIEVLNNAIEKVEHPAELIDLLGDVYLQKGNRIEAEIQWLKAIDSGSRNTLIKKKIDEGKYVAPRYY